MSFSADRVELARGARSAVIVPELPRGGGGHGPRRDRESRVGEACGLALAIGVTIVDTAALTVRTVHPATMLGKGQVQSLAGRLAEQDVELVIVDAALTPIQQRNLETAWNIKVIDRTALILEIFGERAATAEGRMQVELAHLDYQQGRLVRSWTHLERQRGGFGFLGGPGETQIEADRRLIRDRMAHIRRSLDGVRRTRALHRQRRQRAPWPVVALVGYTNAGKSTLFNRLSASAVTAQDMLFATLDPTMRQIRIAGLGKVILSDTVGFVSDLPTQLVAAFRATLEEVQSADVLLHVRDISHGDTGAQRDDVLDVLADLGIVPGEAGPPIIEIWNKIDNLPADERSDCLTLAHRAGAVPLSALTGEGIEQLGLTLSEYLGGDEIERTIHLSPQDGRIRAWLHRHGKILDERVDGDGRMAVRVRLSALNNGRLGAMLNPPAV